MSTSVYPPEELRRRAQELYVQQIRPQVEADNIGKYLVLDIETGDYEMSDDELAASHRIRQRHPNAQLYSFRVGYPAAIAIGGRFAVKAH